MKAALHQAALQKSQHASSGIGAFDSDPAQDKERCCTVAMFLGTMNLPASGETLALGDTALACCRQQLCPKFATQSDCSWISSGDLSWKEKLSDDLDKVQTIDHRLEDLRASDLNDPAAINEENILTAERERIENSELQRLAKVAPLTAMCDQVLDSDQPASDIAEEQEARIQCITSFVDIAYGACQWQPAQASCESLVYQPAKAGATFGGTFTITLVIACILGVTYYAAKPAATGVDQIADRSEYATIDQLPSDLGGKGGGL